jgi:hypothetical protein
MQSHGIHQHVGWVKLKDGTTLSRDEVFAAIQRGVKFETYSPHGISAKVIRVHCRTAQHDYLRTDRDLSREDNLDELPLF